MHSCIYYIFKDASYFILFYSLGRHGTLNHLEQLSIAREGEKYDVGTRERDSQRGNYLLSILSTFMTLYSKRLSELSSYLPRQYSTTDAFDNNCLTVNNFTRGGTLQLL